MTSLPCRLCFAFSLPGFRFLALYAQYGGEGYDRINKMSIIFQPQYRPAICAKQIVTRAALINRPCQGELGQLLNHFLPTHLLKEKRPKGNRTVRVYGPALTPYARVLASAEVLPTKKRDLKTLHEQLNPFVPAREVERQKKEINARRLLKPC